MRSIYIVMSQTGTILSRAIKGVTGDEYNHVSISLNENLEPMYSFGRKYPDIPFVGSFVEESINSGTFKKFSGTTCKVVKVQVTNEQYKRLWCKINQIKFLKDKYKYNLLGLFLALFKIELHPETKFYCSEFVKHVLKSAGVDVSMISAIAHPIEFGNLQNSEIIYKGLLCNYPSENVLDSISQCKRMVLTRKNRPI